MSKNPATTTTQDSSGSSSSIQDSLNFRNGNGSNHAEPQPAQAQQPPTTSNNNNNNITVWPSSSSEPRVSGDSGLGTLWQRGEDKRVSISASLQGSGGRESSYYDYSPILEKATQVDVSSSSGFPNFHDSSSADSSFQRSSDDTVPSISRQVSINMVRETTQRMETLLGELKDLRRSTSEQRSSNLSRNTTNRDSAYTSGSGSSLRYGKQRRTVSTTAAVQPSTSSSQRASPVFDHHQTHPVKAPPTPPRTLEDEQHMQHQPQLLKTPPPQPQRSASVASHTRSHSLPVSMATHIATRPLTLSPLKNSASTSAHRSPSSSSQQQHQWPHMQPHRNNPQETTDYHDDKEEEDLDGLMSSLDSYRNQLDRLNGNREDNNNNSGGSRTPSPNNYISAPSSPAFMKNIGQPPSAKPPPPPPAKPPSLPATWQQQPSLKEEMDYLLDVPSAPFLDKRASHDSSTESFTTAQSPSDKEELQELDEDENSSSCERTATGNVSHSSGHTLRVATEYHEEPLPPPPPSQAPLRDSVYSSSSPILGPLNQHTQSTRQLASPVKDQPSATRKSKSRAEKEKAKERRREKKREKREQVPSKQRPFSQPNIQHLMEMSNNSFQLDQIDLPPDERHLLEKFIDALSKLSVEINLDERKKVEGKRRLQNALRAIEGWI